MRHMVQKQKGLKGEDRMKITMAHGGGGKDSADLMKNIFGKHFDNEILNKMEDAALVDPSLFCNTKNEGMGKIACSTDSFVVTPLEFPGGDIGKLCVCGTLNDLLMMGAQPLYITCGFIIEEGLETDLLERIVLSMAETAKEAGVKIIAGDTKVIEGSGGLYINTTGIGHVPNGRDISAANCKKGDKILLSGTLGEHHACILSARMEIENGIRSDCAFLSDVANALLDADINVRTMRDVTRGGLATVLNEIAESSSCEMVIREKDIPLSAEVKGLTDILGLDPMYMANEGKMIAVIPEKEAERAIAAVKKTAHGKEAVIIGEVSESLPGSAAADIAARVTLITPLGGTRVLDMLYGEGLPRIC